MKPPTNLLSTMPRTVWILGFASLLNDVSSEMIHSILPLFLVGSLGASLTTVGFIEGLAECIGSVLKVFSGALSDQLGHRKGLLVGGYALSTCVKPLFALATSSVWVLAARAADRVGKGIRVAPRDALVADTTSPEIRGAAYGLRQSLDTVGALLGPLAAFALLQLYSNDFRLVFWLALIPAALCVLLLIFGIDETVDRVSHPTKANIDFSALRSLGRRYWIVLLVAFLFNLGNSSDAFLLLKLQSVGAQLAFIPLALVVMNATYAISAYPAGLLSDRFGRRGLIVAGISLYSIVYFGMAAASDIWHVWLLLSLYGIQLGLTQGVFLALVSDTVPEHLRGTGFGFYSLLIGFTLLPASLLAGMLWQYVSPGAAFMLGGWCALLSLFLFLVSGAATRSGNAQ
jgi:MFS family permease